MQVARRYGKTDDRREWVQFLRSLNLGDRFEMPPCNRKVFGVPLVGRSITWIELDGALELFFARQPVPIVFPVSKRQGGVGFGRRFVDFQRFARRCLGVWVSIPGRPIAQSPSKL